MFGTRAAEHIAGRGLAHAAPGDDIRQSIAAAIAEIQTVLRPASPLTFKKVRASVQARMSDEAGLICTPAGIAAARAEARDLNARIGAEGLAFGRPAEALRALQWRHMALASEAVLAALDHYVRHDGGSRGARAICDSHGESVPEARTGPLEEFRFREERLRHRAEQIVVWLADGAMQIAERPNRPFDETAKPFFERDWPDWLTGRIYDAQLPAE